MANENGHMCNLDKLYQGCRTYRRFLQKPVDNEIIAHALDNARIASCSKNAQPLRYIACVSHSMVDEIRPLCKYGALLPPDVGMPKENEHPTAFVAVVKQKNASTFADFDAGLAV
ncbi:MAG: nitroreductase family protein, partial [Eggerthellaceae bacterium]|nr:nitroreductase family protein [Eggerthellaceae bacterium]